MHRIVVDVQSGEITEVELTAEEIAEIEARPQPEPPPVLTTEQKLQAAGLTVAELRQLFGLPEPTPEP
jgi:hypothetical protein